MVPSTPPWLPQASGRIFFWSRFAPFRDATLWDAFRHIWTRSGCHLDAFWLIWGTLLADCVVWLDGTPSRAKTYISSFRPSLRDTALSTVPAVDSTVCFEKFLYGFQ